MEEVKSWHKVRITNRHARSSNFYNNNGRDSVGWFGADVSAVALQMPIFLFVCFVLVSFDVFGKTQHIIHFGYWLFRLWKLTLTTDQLETQHIAHYAMRSFSHSDANANEQTADADKNIGTLSITGNARMKFQDEFEIRTRSWKEIQMKINGFCGQNMHPNTKPRPRTHAVRASEEMWNAHRQNSVSFNWLVETK